MIRTRRQSTAQVAEKIKQIFLDEESSAESSLSDECPPKMLPLEHTKNYLSIRRNTGKMTIAKTANANANANTTNNDTAPVKCDSDEWFEPEMKPGFLHLRNRKLKTASKPKRITNRRHTIAPIAVTRRTLAGTYLQKSLKHKLSEFRKFTFF